jgi:anti-anti-sigma regulatory factor
VPVVTASAEIDVTTAEQLRSVLLEAGSRGHTTIVVDMSGRAAEFLEQVAAGALSITAGDAHAGR